MKKLIFIILIALFAIACTHQPDNGGNKKVTYITIIEIRADQDLDICWYRVQTKGGPYAGQTLWFNDVIGKYKAGEILNK